MSDADAEQVLSSALRDFLKEEGVEPNRPNYWSQARTLIRTLGGQGVVVSATLDREQRRIALQHAVATRSAMDTGKVIRNRARRFLDFLNGEQPKEHAEPFRGDAPDELHDVLDLVWSTLSTQENGVMTALSGDDGDEPMLRLLRESADDDLRRAGLVLQVLRVGVTAVRAQRSERG